MTEPEVTERRAWLPPGRWVEWWDSTKEAKDGAFRLGRVKVLGGDRDRTLDAPLGEPPLLLRAGAVLPLLDREVETLSPYSGDAGLVRAEDRASRLRLLAVPRDKSKSALPDGGVAKSREHDGGWELRLRFPTRMRVDIEASLGALKKSFRPSRLTVDGEKLPASKWSYVSRSQVLRAAIGGKRVHLVAE